MTFDVTGLTFDGTPLSDIFSELPAISASGTLTFKSKPNGFGIAAIKVKVRDNGGTANGGVDSSAEQSFWITIFPINDPPKFAPPSNNATSYDADVKLSAKTGQDVATISANDPDTGGTLHYSILSGNSNDLFAIDNKGKVRLNKAAMEAVASEYTLTLYVEDAYGGCDVIDLNVHFKVAVGITGDTHAIEGSTDNINIRFVRFALSDTINSDLDVKFSASDDTASIAADLENDSIPTSLGKAKLYAATSSTQTIVIAAGQANSDPITVWANFDTDANGNPLIEWLQSFTVTVESNGALYEIVDYSSDSKKDDTDTYASVECDILDGVKAFINGREPVGISDPHLIFQDDVTQGSHGDCFLMAAMICLARSNPGLILSQVITTLGPLTFQVKLYNAAGELVAYDISGNILFRGPDMADLSSTTKYDYDNEGNVEIWPQLIEIAYAQGLAGGWDELGNGAPVSDAWKALTGGTADFWSVTTMTDNSEIVTQIQNFLNQGKQVVFTTVGSAKNPFDASTLPAGSTQSISPVNEARPLSGHHAYVVTNVFTDPSGVRWVELYNPWGIGHIRVKESILSTVSGGIYGLGT